MNLKPSQQREYDAILAWLQRYTTAASLIGYAGTGKTTLIAYLAEQLRKEGYNIAIAAPTHQAKEVLSSKCPRIDAFTSASLIGLGVDETLEDFNPHSPQFIRKNKSKVKDYSLIIHDESSMLPKAYYEYLVEEAEDCGAKVLFVGDDAQLPPVGDSSDSPALHCEDTFVLSEMIRQDESNPLGYLLVALRLDIDNCRGRAIPNHMFNDFWSSLPVEIRDEMKGCTANYFSKVLKASKIQMRNNQGFQRFDDVRTAADIIELIADDIAYGKRSKAMAFTNNAVGELNRLIRKNLYPKTAERIVVGEKMIGYRTITDATGVIPVIINSKEYTVNYIRDQKDIAGYECWAVKFDEAQNEVLILKPEYYQAYAKEYKERLKAGIDKRQWKQFYSFRNNYLLMDSLDLLMKDRDLPSKSIDYAYAVTIHKSQGSTFHSGYVDVGDAMKLIHIDKGNKFNFYRMLYVAISRQTNITHLFIPSKR